MKPFLRFAKTFGVECFAFVLLFLLLPFGVSLSMDDSFLFSSSSFSNHHRKQLQQFHRQAFPGIWKLRTDALPYERDVRSRLNQRFAQEKRGERNRHGGGNDENDDGETILLKLNQDGSFRQCDEGYREGRWIQGRWKLQQLEETGENCRSGTIVLLLLLAMNRQYFGPPYDVLLEATLTYNSTNQTTAVVSEETTRRDETEKDASSSASSPQQPPHSSPLQHWKGVVRKGKFLRPVPGRHPLDPEGVPLLGPTGETTDLLANPQALGGFTFEQALAANAIDGPRVKPSAAANASKTSEETILDNDETFFVPFSSSDDGVLQ